MDTLGSEIGSIQMTAPTPIPWSRMTSFELDPWRLERQRIVSLNRRHAGAVAFDIMRTKVLRDAAENRWSTLGISAPLGNCGKSTVAVNLAVSIARHEKVRVALIDLDLRQPKVARMFGLAGRYATEEFLRGECLAEDFLARVGDNFAVGASPQPVANPAELLHCKSAAQVLARLRADLGADIIIYNLPPLLDGDDCLGLLPLVEASLLVVGAEQSTVEDIDITERQMRDRTRLLGVVLNKCRYHTSKNSNFLA
jgi:protein-tyrosine kinase